MGLVLFNDTNSYNNVQFYWINKQLILFKHPYLICLIHLTAFFHFNRKCIACVWSAAVV